MDVVQGDRSETLVLDVCGEEGKVVCEVENMMGLVRESLVLDRALVTRDTQAQSLVSGDWRPRPVLASLVAGVFVLVFV